MIFRKFGQFPIDIGIWKIFWELFFRKKIISKKMCRKFSGLFWNIPKFYKGFPLENPYRIWGCFKKVRKFFDTFFSRWKNLRKKSSQKIFQIPMSIGNCPNFRKIILRKSLEQAKRAKNQYYEFISYFFRNLTNPVVPPGDMLWPDTIRNGVMMIERLNALRFLRDATEPNANILKRARSAVLKTYFWYPS